MMPAGTPRGPPLEILYSAAGPPAFLAGKPIPARAPRSHRRSPSGPFKAQKPRSLEGELSAIPFRQHAKRFAGHAQLHAVAALHLKRHVVRGSRRKMSRLHGSMMVAGHIRSLGHHGGVHSQPGRMIVFVPLPNAAGNRDNKYAQNAEENQKENNLKSSAKEKAHVLCAFPGETFLPPPWRPPLPNRIPAKPLIASGSGKAAPAAPAPPRRQRPPGSGTGHRRTGRAWGRCAPRSSARPPRKQRWPGPWASPAGRPR